MGTRYESGTCEPFRAWNRLEPRTRKREFDQSIRAEVHDPLWMLARQWQFGEFRGEDTGSAIFAKIQIEHTRINQFQAGNHPDEIVKFDLDIPFEKVVESIDFEIGFKGRVRAGKHFMKLLHHYLKSVTAYDAQQYQEILSELYPIQKPEWNESDSDELKVQKAKLLANNGLIQFLSQFAGTTPDGLQLYKNLKTRQADTVAGMEQNSGHRAQLLLCIANFISWFEDCFDAVPKNQHSSWNHQQLEYQFACSLPEKDAEPSLLVVDGYASGNLDWYSFDIEKRKNRYTALTNATTNEDDIKTETLSFIPTEASFAGMPNNRWWEFEDGKVDLGNISADTTDIAKSVVAEYALIYGNNWFVVPYTLPVGSLSKINGLLVTDVFGQKTFVEAAAQGETDDWASWGLFNLSVKKHSGTLPEPCDTRLFLPPSLVKLQESDAVEEVLMLRDEMANMVWGIETMVNNLLNRGTDGHALANENRKRLHGEDEPPLEAAEEAFLKYMLSNEVPENWIPFIPTHVGPDNRAIHLQRASMPRKTDSGYLSIRPRTEVLRFGFRDNLAHEVGPHINVQTDKQLAPYFVNEEEVPRAGAKISGTLQRTRWMNGKIINWYGYKKQLGKGEGSSGLQFDKVALLKKNKEKKA